MSQEVIQTEVKLEDVIPGKSYLITFGNGNSRVATFDPKTSYWNSFGENGSIQQVYKKSVTKINIL